jgi:hypothetical protein
MFRRNLLPPLSGQKRKHSMQYTEWLFTDHEKGNSVLHPKNINGFIAPKKMICVITTVTTSNLTRIYIYIYINICVTSVKIL